MRINLSSLRKIKTLRRIRRRILSDNGARAVPLLKLMLCLAPLHADINRAIARQYQRQKRWDEALDHRERVIAAEPDDFRARHMALKSLVKLEELVAARELFWEAASRLPETADDCYELGRMATLLDEHAIAVNYFERTAALRPHQPDLQASVGRALLEIGALLRARECLQRAADLNKSASCEADLAVIDGLLRSARREARSDPEPAWDGTVSDLYLTALIDEVGARGGLGRAVVPGSVVLLVESLEKARASEPAVEAAIAVAESRLVTSVWVLCNSVSAESRKLASVRRLEAAGVSIVGCGEEIRSIADLAAHELTSPLSGLLRHMPRSRGMKLARMAVALWALQPEILHICSERLCAEGGVAGVIADVPRIVLHPVGPSPRAPSANDSRAARQRWYRRGFRRLLTLPRVSLSVRCQWEGSLYREWLGIDPRQIGILYGHPAPRAPHIDSERAQRYRWALRVPREWSIVASPMSFADSAGPLLWVETAAALARRHGDVGFLLLGTGPARDHVLDRIDELGLASCFHVLGIGGEVTPWYEVMDIMLWTSSDWRDGQRLFEAQHVGVPVVAADTAYGSDAILGGRSGFVTEGTPERLAERLSWALEHPEWRAEARLAGPAHIQARFSRERMIADTLSVYGMSSKNPATDRAIPRQQS